MARTVKCWAAVDPVTFKVEGVREGFLKEGDAERKAVEIAKKTGRDVWYAKQLGWCGPMPSRRR